MGESNQFLKSKRKVMLHKFIKVWQKVLKPFLISLSHLTYINYFKKRIP